MESGERNRIHLNDAKLARDDPNEMLLSIRNLSSIASVDRAAGKINWLKTGPWVNQHDVTKLNDGLVSVFGNNFSRGAWKFVPPGRSEIYLYAPESDRVTAPYAPVLRQVNMHTEYEGRVRILDNGDAFIEETNRHRLLRVSPDKVRWEYVNGITDDTTGALHWTRYLENDRITPALLDRLTCETS